jgi:hypothetical protein
MCWSGHRDIRDSWVIERRLRADRSPDRSTPRGATLRVSDADRQSTIDALSRHTADGRLTLEEFEARVDETLQATTHRDLEVALRELPADRPGDRRPRIERRIHVERRLRAAMVWMLIIVVSVAALGLGTLWWLLPLAWFRFARFGQRGHTRRRRSIERRRDDELTLV